MNLHGTYSDEILKSKLNDLFFAFKHIKYYSRREKNILIFNIELSQLHKKRGIGW